MSLFTMPGLNYNDGSEVRGLLDLVDMRLSFDAEALFDSIDAVGDLASGGDSSASDGGGCGD